MNELVVSAAIGLLTGSGVWLLLRPRTFQVAVGLSLLSYAVNLFIFVMGRLRTGAAPIVSAGAAADPCSVGERRRRCRSRMRTNGRGTRSRATFWKTCRCATN